MREICYECDTPLAGPYCPKCNPRKAAPYLKDDIAALEAENERLSEALQQIQQWADAYPETVFTVPNLVRMREVLTEAGMPTALDAAHGTWGRHIADGIGKIARAALKGET